MFTATQRGKMSKAWCSLDVQFYLTPWKRETSVVEYLFPTSRKRFGLLGPGNQSRLIKSRGGAI